MFRNLLLTAALLVTPVLAQTYGGVSLTPPPGWTFDGSNPETAVFRRLGDPAGRQVLMLMLPPGSVEGTPEEWFARVTRHLGGDGPSEVLEGARWVELNGGGRQAFELRRVDTGSGTQLRLSTALVSGGRALVFVLVAPSEEVMRGASEDLSALTASALPSLRAGTGPSPQTGANSGVTGNGEASGRLGRALAQGYARGERAVIYRSASWEMTPHYGAGGVALIPALVVQTAAFLPGGVFLDVPGRPDFRFPDPRGAGTWKKVAHGYEVTLPDGEKRVYRSGPTPGTLVLGQTTLTVVPRLTPDQVAGTFRAGRSFSAGGNGLGEVSNQSSLELDLRADGRYRLSGTSETQGGTVSTGRQDTQRGSWTFDPASYTLTLKAENGAVTRGAFYPLTPFTGMGRGEVSWHLFGDDDWLSS